MVTERFSKGRAVHPEPTPNTVSARPLRAACMVATAAVLALTCPPLTQAQFASEVTQYTAGSGIPVEWGTGLAYDQTASVLGEPSRITPGEWGGPIDPFNPPYLREQVLSIGTGGSLTVKLDRPITDDPLHPYGCDFLVFGGTGFIITNGDYTGGGITDGSRLGITSESTRVSVSSDGEGFFLLDPDRTPAIEALFPTDGSGDFAQPVDPALTEADFADLGLSGIRTLYGGSGGGVGFDLAWALDANGRPADLDEIRYIRIEVLGGHAEIDGLAAVTAVPEPAVAALGFFGAITLLVFGNKRTRSDVPAMRTPSPQSRDRKGARRRSNL